jgi:DNA-binding NarL/FixJ family response regulator
VLVEDEPEVRDRLAALVRNSDDYHLDVAACNVEQGLDSLKQFRPDILLVDLGLPDGSGIELIRAIHQLRLDTQALVISGFHDEHTVFNALEAGAQGYLLKYENSDQILASLRQMQQGGAPISPLIARMMLKKFQRFPEPELKAPEVLTDRQLLILKLVSQGFSSKEIAEKLDISYYTVTTHIKNIYNKLQVNSRTEALLEANKLGLLGS